VFLLASAHRSIRNAVVGFLSVVLVLAGLALAGCGGGSDKENGERRGGEEVDQAREEALNKIPTADRTAFLQLATAIGALRARAAPVAVGTASRLTRPNGILAASSQVTRLKPTDQELARLRDRLVPVLTRFAKAPISGAASRRAAKAALHHADRIEAGLRSYVQRTPAIGGAIPD
jgi:hypothetical protein